ncbi:MAG TPA: hypothetical protein VNJ09_02465 [Chthonomonadales bacterium]|nr:hypothetical protein [Chthonomonadales bacterium]
MVNVTLPRIRLGHLAISRLIAGGNPISGFSHQNAERSRQMLEYFTVEQIKEHWRTCEEHGINALIARADAFIMRVLAEYWREGGHIRWIAQTAPEHRDPFANIRQAHQVGASAIFLHGGEIDRLFAQGEIEEIRTRVEFVRSLGVPVGMAAHEPCNHLEAQALGFPLDFHLVCMYNLTGYQGRREEPSGEPFNFADRAIALDTLQKLNRPCIAYKVMGAGRLGMPEALADVGQALRPTDGVLIGMFPPDRPNIVAENVRAVASLPFHG